jgi:hypothetical protein
MKILGTLKSVRSVYDSVIKLKKMGVNIDGLIIDLNIILDEWKLKTESLELSKDYSSKTSISSESFYVLFGMEWILVTTGVINEDGSLKWTFEYNDNDIDSGTSKVGRWAHCDVNGSVKIDLSLDDLSMVPLHKI